VRRAGVVVLAALVVTGCAAGPPLRRGFESDESTPASAPVTTTARPSGSLVAEVRDAKKTPEKPSKDAKQFVLPTTALVADGLEVQESAVEINSPLLTLCGEQVDSPDNSGRQRVVTKSTSGASRLEQETVVYAQNAAEGHLDFAKCDGAEKMTFTEKDRVGWCEPRAGGRGACGVLIAEDDVLVSLKLETISVQRAREVVTRLAAATPLK